MNRTSLQLAAHERRLASVHRVASVTGMAIALACMGSARPAIAGGGVFIAGQGSAMEQTFNEALTANPAKSKEPFWVVVAGNDIKRMTKSGAAQEDKEWIKSVNARGGMIYVCRNDLMRNGLKEEDLLDGVRSVYGYGADEWAGLLPAKKEGILLPENIKQSQLILRTCAGGPNPGR